MKPKIKADDAVTISKIINFKLCAGMNNVFDEKFAASIFTNAVGFGGSAPSYYDLGNPVNYDGVLG